MALVPTDCESYCKPVKGNLKINMKKYCKKDYGKEVGAGISAADKPEQLSHFTQTLFSSPEKRVCVWVIIADLYDKFY